MVNVLRRFSSEIAEKLIAGGKFRQARYTLNHELERFPQAKSLDETAFSAKLSLLRRISLCELRLKNYLAAEMSLEQCISLIKARQGSYSEDSDDSRLALEAHNEILMLFLMRHNPTKAAAVGKQLIEDATDPNFLSKIHFLLGTTEILRENISSAKDHLYKILSSQLPIVTLGMAYNNFGAACWWDAFPNYSSLTADEEATEGEEEEYSEKIYKSKHSDFSYSIDFLQTAIYKFEVLYESVAAQPDYPSSSSLNKMQEIKLLYTDSVRIFSLLELFNNDMLSLEEHDFLSSLRDKDPLFKNPLSGVPLFNLAEVLLSTSESNEQRQQGLLYLHLAFRSLHSTLVVSKQIKDGVPVSLQDQRISELYIDYYKLYRSLYIRCLTIMSMINSLDQVRLLGPEPRAFEEGDRLHRL